MTLLNRLDNIPLFVSDGLICYKTVLQESYSREVPIAPTGKRGRPKLPKKILNPELDCATVHKTGEKGKVTKVEKKSFSVMNSACSKNSRKALAIPSIPHTLNGQTGLCDKWTLT
ncbi:MAG: hypothetical protein LBR08_08975 [Bacteroidales bacterium]|nr:hypothetical protein [Bacteroidales bacterium]